MEQQNLSPSEKLNRNNCGLLEHIKYPFYEDGRVNWRALIPKEYLYVNTQQKAKIEKKYDKKIDEIDIEKDQVSDKDLVILLGGIRHLAYLRGFSKVEYKPIIASPKYAATVCRITWIPNHETQMQEVVFEAMAAASEQNTTDFGQVYICEISENRAFCRAVREFLNIGIVSREELSEKINEDTFTPAKSEPAGNPVDILATLMQQQHYTFDQIKTKLVKINYPNADKFEKLIDIPMPKILEIIEKLKKVKSKKA